MSSPKDPNGPVVVVGAGMAGLGAAATLRRAGRDVVLLERLDYVGGLARSVTIGGHTFDVGPHYFFLDVSREVNDLVQSCLRPEEWRPIDFKISTYIGRAHVPWPPAFSALFKLPPGAVVQYIKNSLKKRIPDTYLASDFLTAVYGRTMFRIFLDPYLRKKVPVSDGAFRLHRDWYNQTARTIHNVPDVKRDKLLQYEPKLVEKYLEAYPQVREERNRQQAQDPQLRGPTAHMGSVRRAWLISQGLVKNAFARNYKKVLYPPGGVGVITERVKEDYLRRGGVLHLKASNVEIQARDHHVERVSWDGGSVENPACVVWTGSIHRLCSMVGIPREELPFMTILLGMMRLRKPLRDEPELYTYVADPDIVFNRIYYPNRSVPGLCPPGKDSLCVEITPSDQRLETAPANVGEQITRGLERLRVCKAEDIEDITYVFVPDSYPVYPPDYREKIDRIWSELRKFDNLHSVGRSGQFWYNNMARSLRVGIETARDILGTFEP